MPPEPPSLTLDVVSGRYAIARLDAAEPPPPWAFAGPEKLAAVIQRGDELTVICPEDRVPAGTTAERGYAGLVVRGPLDFSLTGILATLSEALASAGIPIFALSTYDTDVLLVPGGRLQDAVTALTARCHHVATA